MTMALTGVSETGADLSRFPTAKHFASWLGLSPGTEISGGKLLSGRTLPNANRAAQALRFLTDWYRTDGRQAEAFTRSRHACSSGSV